MKKKLLILAIFMIISSFIVRGIVVSTNHDDEENILLSLGNFLLNKGYDEKALAIYEKILEDNPDNIAALNNLGYYYKEKNPLLAEDYFNQALEVTPDYEKARNNLALLYNSLKEYGKSAEQFEILVTKYDNINYKYDLAINLAQKFRYETENMHDLEEALGYFKQVYEIDPDYKHTMDNIKVLNEIIRLS